MPFKKGKSGNPTGRPTMAFNEQLRLYIGKNAQKYVEFINRIIDGEEKTTIVVQGKFVEVPIPLEKRGEFALRLLNKLLPDLKAQELSGQLGLKVTYVTNVPDIE